MNALKRTIPIPKVEIAWHGATRRQVFGKSPPLIERLLFLTLFIHQAVGFWAMSGT